MKKSRKKSCAVNAGRWMSYAAAGAVTALAATNDAQAVILYSGPLTTMINPPHNPISPNAAYDVKSLSGSHHLMFIMNGAKVGSHGFQNLFAASRTFSVGNYSLLRFAIAGGGSHNVNFPNNAARIAAGVKISGLGIRGFATSVADSFSGQPLGEASGSHAGFPWSGNGTTGFLAFEFKATKTGPQYYGWAQVKNTTGGPWDDFELLGYAYSDNVNFLTGQTTMPEPATMGLLAMGALGLLAARRIQKAKKAEAA